MPKSLPIWALIVPPDTPDDDGCPAVLTVTEDCLAAARARDWIVLGVDGEVYAMPVKVRHPPTSEDVA